MKNNIDARKRYMIVVRVWVVIRLFAPDCTTKMYGWMRALLPYYLILIIHTLTFLFSPIQISGITRSHTTCNSTYT